MIMIRKSQKTCRPAFRLPSTVYLTAIMSVKKEKPQSKVHWNHKEHTDNVLPAPVQKFCAALNRPDDRTRRLAISIPDKIVIRKSEKTGISHVLVMGTVDFILDPLACPFAKQTEACKGFFATAPHFLEAHLEAKHALKNVILNFVCPCPAKCNDGHSCPEVRFDPGDMHMLAHLRSCHRKYYEVMRLALLSAEPEPGLDPQRAQKRLYFRQHARRLYFPAWTHDKDRLFPSQIIPDKIVIPAEIDQNGVIKYTCKIDPCSRTPIGDGGPYAAFDLHMHMLTEHGKQYDMFTSFFHECPGCGRLINAVDKQLESHVKAMHEELLRKGRDCIKYSEQAMKNLKALEDRIPAAVIGEAITNGLQPSDGSKGTAKMYLQRYTCPMKPCDKVFLGDGCERDYMVWHIRADHRDDWNVATDALVKAPK
ncbi:uncharacterized protein LOC129585814 isoform X2 [Paramacrobiotus metropolitanus]|uniref:uncharacterized protein LOC129585814 isoform X2 n=1 Tax=Paramacrobiotus metropolitanus TaxID=2943436 RepID=UPI0024464B10|nr:uncharacterized protein LOC129585814 isoform X2 [Paramacrobiotus metropolitanus]